jgi:NADPH:quinone reductase-like Zn-dependent oxidoreductase
VIAIVGGGAPAEYARVDSCMAMAVPDRLSFADAAAIPEVFVTAHEWPPSRETGSRCLMSGVIS